MNELQSTKMKARKKLENKSEKDLVNEEEFKYAAEARKEANKELQMLAKKQTYNIKIAKIAFFLTSFALLGFMAYKRKKSEK